MLRVARLAELVRDLLDLDRDVSGGHLGRYASVMSFVMSGFSGNSLVSTNEAASTSSAFGSKRPVALKIGRVSLYPFAATAGDVSVSFAASAIDLSLLSRMKRMVSSQPARNALRASGLDSISLLPA